MSSVNLLRGRCCADASEYRPRVPPQLIGSGDWVSINFARLVNQLPDIMFDAATFPLTTAASHKSSIRCQRISYNLSRGYASLYT